MIARHRLKLEICREVGPDRGRIIGIVGWEFSPYEFDRAVIEVRAIARQSTVGTLARPLHGGRVRCARGNLTWRASVGISSDIQPAFRWTDDVGKGIAYRQFPHCRCTLIRQSRTEPNALF